MSRQPIDDNNYAIPILPLKAGGGQKVSIAAASARSTAVTTQAVTLHANCNCYVEVGDAVLFVVSVASAVVPVRLRLVIGMRRRRVRRLSLRVCGFG